LTWYSLLSSRNQEHRTGKSISAVDLIQIWFCIQREPFEELELGANHGALAMRWWQHGGELPAGIHSPGFWTMLPTVARIELALLLLQQMRNPDAHWVAVIGERTEPDDWQKRVRNDQPAVSLCPPPPLQFLPHGLTPVPNSPVWWHGGG